jgi:hypothetical protein
MFHANEVYWTVFEVLDLSPEVADRVSKLQETLRDRVTGAIQAFFNVIIETMRDDDAAQLNYSRCVTNFHHLVDFVYYRTCSIRVIFNNLHFIVHHNDRGHFIIVAFDFVQ